jgi:hypothetical protein
VTHHMNRSKNQLDLNIPLDENTGDPVRSTEATQGGAKKPRLDPGIDLNNPPTTM